MSFAGFAGERKSTVMIDIQSIVGTGICHSRSLAVHQVSLKGARALIKVFTDLQASLEDVQSWFSVGLEPIIGLVRAA